ncbi:hypothetical protein NC653_009649 [Populus alba x Populus x berolinensis]|uniref:Uncharacterized protein n=1 Tax=Populus alba x Populus x berolinensis TaxID=444605 RepID=A0AAD6R9N9_9ROSI|nr:hypothetical protein NC653_009649 [Populus alba x Populus x berolinensis]
MNHRFCLQSSPLEKIKAEFESMVYVISASLVSQCSKLLKVTN